MKHTKPLTTGEKILLLMHLRDRSQAQLVRETGMAQNHLSLSSHGKRQFKLWEALGLARALDVPLEWLADETAGLPIPARASEENKILEIVRSMPYETARARLCAVPEVDSGERPAPSRGGKDSRPGRWNGKKNA